MQTSQLLTLAVAALGLTSGAVAQGNNPNRGGGNNNGTNTGNNHAGGNAGGDLTLLASNVQAGSNFVGNPNAEQSNSHTYVALT